MKILDAHDTTKFLYITIPIHDDKILKMVDQNENEYEFSIEDDEFVIMMKLSSLAGNVISFDDLITSAMIAREFDIELANEIKNEIDKDIVNMLKGLV